MAAILGDHQSGLRPPPTALPRLGPLKQGLVFTLSPSILRLATLFMYIEKGANDVLQTITEAIQDGETRMAPLASPLFPLCMVTRDQTLG